VALWLVGVLVLAIAGVADAALPQAQSMVLTTSAFAPGAIVAAQTVTPADGLPQRNYASASSRVFSGAVVGDTHLITAISSDVVMKSQTSASIYMTSLIVSMRSPKQRQAALALIAKAFPADDKATISFRRDRTLKVGNSALDLDFTIETSSVTIDTDELYVQEGPAIGYFVYATTGASRLSAGQADELAKNVAAQMVAASGSPPADKQKPSVGGTLSLGQILTANPGSWASPMPAFAYQWFRCTPAGNGCVAIQGATNPQYTVSTADEGATIAFSTAATNAAGTTLVMSPATGVIP
jgi:hypothetical protein